MATTIQKPSGKHDIIISYLTLREVVGWLGISLSPVLIIGTLLIDPTKHIDISISAYYYSPMRNAFVGIICGIALFLMAYHGYSWLDSLISKLSGIFSLCVAFIPTSPTPDKTDLQSTIHYLAAAAFFVLLSYMSIFLFTKSTASEMRRRKKQRNWVYRVCGIIMLTSVSCIALDNISFIAAHVPFFKETIVFETIALTAFGISWLIKGEFLLKDD